MKLRTIAMPALACVAMWHTGCYGTLESHPVQSQLADPEAAGQTAQQPNVSVPAPIPNPNNPLSADPRTFYGLPRCGDSNLAVCDSFEAGGEGGGGEEKGAALNGNIWEVEVSGHDAQVTLDTAHAARGASAVHVHTLNGGYQHAVLVHKKLFPAAGNTFFGRAFVYMDGEAPEQHFTLFAASGTFPDAAAPTYVRYGGDLGLLEANYVGNGQAQHAGAPMADGSWSDTTPVPTGRWVCMEWQFKGDTNEMHFWLDGIDVPRLAVIGQSNECCKGQVWSAPPYDRVALGWEMYGTSENSKDRGHDLWIDEVALDSQRIGCAR